MVPTEFPFVLEESESWGSRKLEGEGGEEAVVGLNGAVGVCLRIDLTGGCESDRSMFRAGVGIV